MQDCSVFCLIRIYFTQANSKAQNQDPSQTGPHFLSTAICRWRNQETRGAAAPGTLRRRSRIFFGGGLKIRNLTWGACFNVYRKTPLFGALFVENCPIKKKKTKNKKRWKYLGAGCKDFRWSDTINPWCWIHPGQVIRPTAVVGLSNKSTTDTENVSMWKNEKLSLHLRTAWLKIWAEIRITDC